MGWEISDLYGGKFAVHSTKFIEGVSSMAAGGGKDPTRKGRCKRCPYSQERIIEGRHKPVMSRWCTWFQKTCQVEIFLPKNL